MAINNSKNALTLADIVNVTTSSTVLASKRSEKQARVALATFDLPYITFYYNQKLLVYRGGVEEFGDVVGKMKEALSEALDVFYPLGGRLVQDEEGVLLVSCEMEKGVEVVVAEAVGLEVEEFAEGDEPEEIMRAVVPYTGVMNLEGMTRPLLAVQFTKLKNGIAIGCAFNHAILDGNSTWHFMNCWASLARNSPIPNPPLHNRSLARPTRIPLNLPTSPAAHELSNPNPAPASSIVTHLFSFPSSSLLLLKSTTNSSLPPTSKPFSTFQSLASHAWRAISRARRLSPSDITVFAVFTDCRNRLRPPLPDSYFGNLIQAVFTGTAVGPLLASPPGFAAGLLQKAIDAHDEVVEE